ncbi:MAG: hypothetical protein KIT52_13705 [Anaerolineae bacterium]|nr:hypothetical protein [Anaerolineae bacterium]
MKLSHRSLLLLLVLFLSGCTLLSGERGGAPVALSDATLPPPPQPTATATPASALGQPQVAVLSPLLVDDARGRLYASGQVNGLPKLLVLNAADGGLLAAWDTLGQLALDATRNRLAVDRGRQGLAVLDAGTGEILAEVNLPAQDAPPAPQFDTATGTLYAFRASTVYTIDPTIPDITHTTALSIAHTVCDEPAGDAPIVRSAYDATATRLYLSFITYNCVPWVTMTLVAYDAGDMTETGRHDIDIRAQFAPYDGRLFGVSVSRLGPTLHWVWDGAAQWDETSADYSGEPAGIVVDAGRGLVYSALGETLRIIDPGKAVAGEAAVPLLAGSRLDAHSVGPDTLYFVSPSGRLKLWSAANLFDGQSLPRPAPSALPVGPVVWLALSPNWANDRAMMALVRDEACPGAGGALFVLPDPAVGWQPAVLGAPGACEAVTAAAFSPAYGRDALLFAATTEPTTVLRSIDGGRSWTAAETPFPAGVIDQLVMSPAYASDQTLFAHLEDGALYRSRDGGQTWRAMSQPLDVLAALDAPGAAPALFGARGGDLLSSADGEMWTAVGPTPDGETLLLLAAAPTETPQPVLYAFTAGGRFARSLDGGLSWLTVSEMAATAAQLAIVTAAPPATRPVFLLHYREIMASYDDMASVWASTAAAAAGGYGPTAIALPPNFAAEPYLFVGTVDGQVLRVRADPQP